MQTYILLDRSGSMNARWNETITALNSYVEKLPKKTNVTFATFNKDNMMRFDVVADDVPVAKWKPVDGRKLKPDGYTPLMDAVGRMSAMIDKSDAKLCTFLIMTDGAENASTEYSRDTVSQIIKRYKDRGYDVVFIGADFDAFSDASKIGVSSHNTINTVMGSYGETMSLMAAKTVAYASTGVVRGFSDTDRKRAAGQ